MGLFISISSSGEEAIRQDPDLFVEYYTHEAIFLGPTELRSIQKYPDGHETKHYYYPKESARDWLKQYPKFWRMSDQYCDCAIYDQDQITELKKELIEIQKLTQEPNLCKFVGQLMELCEKALKSNLKIFCYGD